MSIFGSFRVVVVVMIFVHFIDFLYFITPFHRQPDLVYNRFSNRGMLTFT